MTAEGEMAAGGGLGVLTTLLVGGCIDSGIAVILFYMLRKDKQKVEKYLETYNFFSVNFVFWSCLYSVLFESQLFFSGAAERATATTPFILAMTAVQARVLYLCFFDFCMETVGYALGLRYVQPDIIFAHHPLSFVGIAYQLYYGIGGGMMACMLLDSLSEITELIEKLCMQWRLLLTQRTFWKVLRVLQWVAWILTRLICYPLASLWAIWSLWTHFCIPCHLPDASFSSSSSLFSFLSCEPASCGTETPDWIYTGMVLVWSLYANVTHVIVFHNILQENDEHLNHLLDLCTFSWWSKYRQRQRRLLLLRLSQQKKHKAT